MKMVKNALLSLLFATLAGTALKLIHYRRKQAQRTFFHKVEKIGKELHKKKERVFPQRKKGILQTVKLS